MEDFVLIALQTRRLEGLLTGRKHIGRLQIQGLDWTRPRNNLIRTDTDFDTTTERVYEVVDGIRDRGVMQMKKPGTSSGVESFLYPGVIDAGKAARSSKKEIRV